MLRLLTATLAVAFLSLPAFAGAACTDLATATTRILAAGNTVLGISPVPHSQAALLLWVDPGGNLVANIVGPAADTGEPCVLDNGSLSLGQADDVPQAAPKPKPAQLPRGRGAGA